MVLTDSVRSFHEPDIPRTRACPPSLPSVPTSLATLVTSSVNAESWSTSPLTVRPTFRNSPLRGCSEELSELRERRSIRCSRSPSDTADSTRPTSETGRTRSSTRAFEASMAAAQEPSAGADLQPFRELSLTSDDPAHPRELAREMQIAVRDLVEDRRDLRHDAIAGNREPLAEVPVPHGNQSDQQPIQRSRIHLGRPVVPGSSAFRARACAPRGCARLHRVPPAGSTVLPGLSLDTCPVFHHGPTRP